MNQRSETHPIALDATLAGRYRIDKRLGQGGMASVYLADDSNLGVPVAIKFPDPKLLENDNFLERFLLETRALVSLRHPNIVKIIDVGQHDGIPYAVMDYLPGGNVNDQRYQDSDGNFIPVVPVFFEKWLNRIADALDFIHRKGYVHRDVKPDNILFDEDGNAFLGDFGIAKIFEETKNVAQAGLTQTGMLIGTPEYMAPEIGLGQQYDGRSDQYSLAVLVYELLVGQRPFVGATPAALVISQTNRQFNGLEALSGRWGKEVADVLIRALANEPGDRFASCVALESALATAFANVSNRQIQERVVSKCPNCAASIAVQPDWIGRIARCNKCSERLHIQATGMVFPVASSTGTPLPAKPTNAPVQPTNTPGQPTHVLGQPTPVSAQPTHTSAQPVPEKSQPTHIHGQPTPPSTQPAHIPAQPIVQVPVAVCPHCMATFQIPIQLRGKSIRCAVCQAILLASEDGRRCFANHGSGASATVMQNGPQASISDTIGGRSPAQHSVFGRPSSSKRKRRPTQSITTAIVAAFALGSLIVLVGSAWFLENYERPPLAASSVASENASLPKNVPAAESVTPSPGSETADRPTSSDEAKAVSDETNTTSEPELAEPTTPATDISKPATAQPQATASADKLATARRNSPNKSNGSSNPPAALTIRSTQGRGADTTVARGQSSRSELGTKPTLAIQTRGDTEFQHAYIRFDLNAVPKNPQQNGNINRQLAGVQLVLHCVDASAAGATIRVYGIDNPNSERWQEEGPFSLLWKNSFSALDLDALPMLAKVSSARLTNEVLTISSPELTDFVRSTPLNTVTLVLAGGKDGQVVQFVSRNGDRDKAPRLSVDVRNQAGADPHIDLIGNFQLPIPSETLDGSSFDWSVADNKVVLVDLWAAWCPPCLQVVPQIREWNRKFDNDDFFAVSISCYEGYKWNAETKRGTRGGSVSPEDERDSINEFAKYHAIDNALAITQRRHFSDLRVRSIPQLMVFDRKGTLRFVGTGAGPNNFQAAQAAIEKLIRE